jgi:hypothetical protein
MLFPVNSSNVMLVLSAYRRGQSAVWKPELFMLAEVSLERRDRPLE